MVFVADQGVRQGRVSMRGEFRPSEVSQPTPTQAELFAQLSLALAAPKEQATFEVDAWVAEEADEWVPLELAFAQLLGGLEG